MGKGLFLHVGYPKTATTTLQVHVFPKHRDLNYIGKYLPDHQFSIPIMGEHINRIIHAQTHTYREDESFRNTIRKVVEDAGNRPTLISTESFLHPWAVDVVTAARRAYEALAPCKVIIVLREQRDMLWSLYRAHGRYCQYLFVQMADNQLNQSLELPLSMDDWMGFQLHQFEKNFAGMLLYGEIVDEYTRIFGKGNVLVLFFEHLNSEPRLFLRKLCEFVGIDADIAFELLADKRENISPLATGDAGSLAEARVRDEFMRKIPRWIVERYQSGNRLLEAQLGIDVRSLGYL